MIRWQQVNAEPFEYAIQQGPHGDEFVKLLNGECLRRPRSEVQTTEPLAWLDLRTAGLSWQNRIVATNPQFVENNGPENFAPLHLHPAQALIDCDEAMVRLSASEVACYRWPEDTAEHRAMRAAFMDGAASMRKQEP